MSVSDLELKTGTSLMAIGGFTGGDPSPTLTQFQQYVADGQVRYFLADSGRGGPFGHREGASADITAWVEKTFTRPTWAARLSTTCSRRHDGRVTPRGISPIRTM